MTKKRLFELQQELQSDADEALRVLNCHFPVHVTIGAKDHDPATQGTFHPEWIEDKGMMRSLVGKISIEDFSKMPKDDLVEMLLRHVLIHELGHVLQLGMWELEDPDEDGNEKERDIDHDAEFGIHFARVYSQIMEHGKGKIDLPAAYADLGLTSEARDGIIEQLAAAIAVDEEEFDAE